jgi:SLT domain-containing protein
MAKLSFLVGLGAGYVLGARAGRERYDQIADKAQSVWRNPRVQAKADQAQQLVKEKASEAGTAASDLASAAGAKVTGQGQQQVTP